MLCGAESPNVCCLASFSLLQSLWKLEHLWMEAPSEWGMQWSKVFSSFDSTISTYGRSLSGCGRERGSWSLKQCVYVLHCHSHVIILKQSHGPTLTVRKWEKWCLYLFVLKGNDGNTQYCHALLPHLSEFFNPWNNLKLLVSGYIIFHTSPVYIVV